MTEKEKEEKKNRPWLLYGYMGMICVFISLCAVCFHYGWLEPREGVKWTVEDMIYMSALACGIFNCMTVPILFREYDNIHPAIRTTISAASWIVLFVLIGAFLDLVKRDDVDWVNTILIIVAAIVIFCVWAYMLKRTDKNGETYEDRIERKSKERSLKLRIKRYDEREVMESRSAMGLPNFGQAEIAWDNRHSYIDVKRYTIAFISMLAFLSVVATIGKHLDSGDGATAAFLLTFIIGILMLRAFIYTPLHCAVLHGAMHYDEGVRYALLMMGGYAVLCSVLSNIVIEAPEPVWDIWGYVVAVIGTFIMFVLTYMLVTVGNKHNGHEFAFFDTDGYAKSQKDPREEEEEEEKE